LGAFGQVEDTESLLLDLNAFIDKEAKASKEFYERQMKETPTFDDSFKENMVNENRASPFLSHFPAV
jgi:hypothetical protein